MKKTIILFILVFSIIFMGCVSSTTVNRTATDEVADLSGRWNITDSRLTSEAMISDCLSRPWLQNFNNEMGRKPVVIVGDVKNKSSEHIDETIFIKDMERELINSGLVRFVASDSMRDQLRSEKVDMASFATEETAARIAAETGADFMLLGTISSITDAVEGKKYVTFQVDLELIRLETHEKVWIGSKEITKLIEQASAGW